MNEGKSIAPKILDVWYRNHPVVVDRDYQKTILPRITAHEGREGFKVQQYGQAIYDDVKHPLMRVLIGTFDPKNPKPVVVLTTTHGYEKGGPLALLDFLENKAEEYAERYDIVVYPCLAPGPYEKNLRYTIGRKDTNRDCAEDRRETQEMSAFVSSIHALHQKLYGEKTKQKFAAAVDLHETPPEDWAIDQETATLNGEVYQHYDIPDGYYALTNRKSEAFVRRLLKAVEDGGIPIIQGDEILDAKAENGIVFRQELPSSVRGTTQQFMEDFAAFSVTTELCFSNPLSDEDRAGPQLDAIEGAFAHLDSMR